MRSATKFQTVVLRPIIPHSSYAAWVFMPSPLAGEGCSDSQRMETGEGYGPLTPPVPFNGPAALSRKGRGHSHGGFDSSRRTLDSLSKASATSC